MYVRPHHRTGWRNDAQMRTHEMKVAAREPPPPPIDDRPECVTTYSMTVVRGIMYKLYTRASVCVFVAFLFYFSHFFTFFFFILRHTRKWPKRCIARDRQQYSTVHCNYLRHESQYLNQTTV